MDLLWAVHGARLWGAPNGLDTAPAPKVVGALLAQEAGQIRQLRALLENKGFNGRVYSAR